MNAPPVPPRLTFAASLERRRLERQERRLKLVAAELRVLQLRSVKARSSSASRPPRPTAEG